MRRNRKPGKGGATGRAAQSHRDGKDAGGKRPGTGIDQEAGQKMCGIGGQGQAKSAGTDEGKMQETRRGKAPGKGKPEAGGSRGWQGRKKGQNQDTGTGIYRTRGGRKKSKGKYGLANQKSRPKSSTTGALIQRTPHQAPGRIAGILASARSKSARQKKHCPALVRCSACAPDADNSVPHRPSRQ